MPSTYALTSSRGIGTAAVPGFIASPALAASLQAVLVDLIELRPQAQQAPLKRRRPPLPRLAPATGPRSVTTHGPTHFTKPTQASSMLRPLSWRTGNDSLSHR